MKYSIGTHSVPAQDFIPVPLLIAGGKTRQSLGPTFLSLFSKFCSQTLLSESSTVSILLPLSPLPKNVHNSVNPKVYMSANSGLTDFFPPELTESHGYLFIYLLMIYILSPSKKDLSASLDVLALPPKSISISRKKITTGGMVSGFVPESAESQEKA